MITLNQWSLPWSMKVKDIWVKNYAIGRENKIISLRCRAESMMATIDGSNVRFLCSALLLCFDKLLDVVAMKPLMTIGSCHLGNVSVAAYSQELLAVSVCLVGIVCWLHASC